MTGRHSEKLFQALRRMRTALRAGAGVAGKAAGRILPLLASGAAAAKRVLQAAGGRARRTGGWTASRLLRLSASSASAGAGLLAAVGRIGLLLLRAGIRITGRTIASLPRLLDLALVAARALAGFIAYLWQVSVALWAFLRPYLIRLLRMMRAHMLATAVTGAGIAAIVILLDRSDPQPVDEKEIPVELRPKATIAALLSLTGRNSERGMEMLRGYRIAADAINRDGITVDGRLSSLHLLVYDDESDPGRAGELAEQIPGRQEKVRALLAPYSSLVARPAAAAAAGNRIPVLAAAASAAGFGSAPPEGVMLLQTPPQEHLLPALELLLERARERNIDPHRLEIALAWLPDPHSAAVAAGLSAALARLGAPPPHLIDLAASEERFRSQADVEADALFVAGYGDGAARIMQHLRDSGRRPAIVALTHCALGRIGSIAPRMASGALCLRHWQPEARYRGIGPLAGRAFVSKYQQLHGRQPTHHAAAAAAAVIVIAEALRRAENDGSVDLQQALAATDLSTFYGPIGFDERGINDRKPMIVSQLQFGKYVPIRPPAAAAGSLEIAGSDLAADR